MQTDIELHAGLRSVQFAATVLTLSAAACHPPFPGPPDDLPDCSASVAYERCGLRVDSLTRQVPFDLKSR